MQIKSRIKQRYDTLSNWTRDNIVLLSGELAVVDCGNQTRFKIGNGISAFTQLPFIDEHVLSTIWVTAHAISQGAHAHSTPFGLAAGWRLSANANYSQALGFKSQTSASHDFSFAWNGDDQSYSVLGEDYYTSHGKGTFNINPLSGVRGFYIGDKSLQDIVNDIDPLNVPIQMIKPISDERMHLSIDLFTDKEMTNSILPSPIDTETSSHFFYNFLPNGNDSHWTSCDVSGFSRESNGLPVLFDIPEVFKELSIDFYSIDALYARYSWYYLSAESRIFSDPYTTTLPATTEVGANAQDVVSKSEFYKLYQNVVPQSQGVVVDDGNYFLTYSTKYNIVTSRVENGEKIALMEYDKHKTYKIDLSTSTSEDVELVFYIGLANGNIEWSEELNAEQHVFERGKHYFIEVRDQKIFVYDGDAVYASQDSGTNVQVSAVLDSGTQIASISVDGVATPIYAPVGGGIYRYPLITAELSTINGSLCCLIQDHTITTIEVSSSATPLVIKLPPKPADNGARDFILRIEVSSSTAPGVTFAGLDESITFDSESEDWMAIEPGLNLISFTETK